MYQVFVTRCWMQKMRQSLPEGESLQRPRVLLHWLEGGGRGELQVGHQQYKSKHHVKAWFCQSACSRFWWCVQQCKLSGSKEPQGGIWGERGRVLGGGRIYGGEELHRWQWEEICECAAVWNNMKNVFRVCLPWIPAVVKLNWCNSKCGFRSEQNELYMMCWQMWDAQWKAVVSYIYYWNQFSLYILKNKQTGLHLLQHFLLLNADVAIDTCSAKVEEATLDWDSPSFSDA